MSTRTPAVSISLVTYNHEKFIADAIRSILEQTFTDLELVIVDDGSTDDTPRVIASFDDPRIVSIRQANAGPGAATNRALAACRGKYVALMTGDDVSVPHRIQKQLEEYERGEPRMLFADCDFIDDDGQPLTGDHYAAGQFDTTPRTRAQMLRRLFDGNFINAVTAFTEMRLLADVGRYDPSLYQLQDYQMWIAWIKKYPIAFLREPLLHFRIRGNNGNLSAPTRAACTRHENELFLIMRRFFDGATDDLFRDAFRAELRRPDLATPLAAQCEQALLFLEARRPELRLLGMERLQALFQDAEAASCLEREFQYPHTKFVEFLKTFDMLDRFRVMTSTLYFDTGVGFKQKRVVFAPHGPRFRQTFDLPVERAVKALRWDPVEGRLCRVRLEKVTWTDAEGRVHQLDPSAVQTNGLASSAGEVVFETVDPNYILPVSGRVKSLTLEGSWQIQNESSTRAWVHALVLRQHEELGQWQRRYERSLEGRLRRAAKLILGPFRQLLRRGGKREALPGPTILT